MGPLVPRGSEKLIFWFGIRGLEIFNCWAGTSPKLQNHNKNYVNIKPSMYIHTYTRIQLINCESQIYFKGLRDHILVYFCICMSILSIIFMLSIQIIHCLIPIPLYFPCIISVETILTLPCNTSKISWFPLYFCSQ